MKHKPPAWASMALNARDMRKAAWFTLASAVFGAVSLWEVVVSLASGVAHGRGNAVYARATSPIGFWFNVSVFALGALISLACLILFVRMMLRGVYRPTFAELEEARAGAPPIVRRLRRGS